MEMQSFISIFSSCGFCSLPNLPWILHTYILYVLPPNVVIFNILLCLLVYQALCLEHLSAHELLVKVTSKLGLQPAEASSFVRVTLTGIMVLVDDTVSEWGGNWCWAFSFSCSFLSPHTFQSSSLISLSLSLPFFPPLSLSSPHPSFPLVSWKLSRRRNLHVTSHKRWVKWFSPVTTTHCYQVLWPFLSTDEGSGRYQVILRELDTNTTLISTQGALPRTV